MTNNFEETIQSLIDFIQRNIHYSGNLTNDTACQLLRDIETDTIKLKKERDKTKDVLKTLINSRSYIYLDGKIKAKIMEISNE